METDRGEERIGNNCDEGVIGVKVRMVVFLESGVVKCEKSPVFLTIFHIFALLLKI